MQRKNFRTKQFIDVTENVAKFQKLKDHALPKNTMLNVKVKIPNLIFQNLYVNKSQQTNII